jgi:hypothetical protein
MAGHGELTGEGREEEREEERGGVPWGGLLWRNSVAAPLSVLLMRLVLSVRERRHEGERRKKEKEGKEKKKEKNMKFFPNLKISEK